MARRSPVATIVVGVITLMAVAGVVLAVRSSGPGASGLDFGLGGRIAVIEVDGLIGDDEQLLEQIRGFRDDGSVRGFVVSINSPGGVVGPSQSVYHELRRLRDDEDRPVIASIGGIGTSGGYYVALGADSIFAMPGSLTGSIGVVMEFPNATELMDKVGVRMEVVKSAEHKDIGSPFREMTEADRALLDSLVRDVYDQFVDVVALERRIQVDEVRRVADGRVMSGKQALEFGLIDRIGNLHDALAAAGRMAGLGENPQVVKPHERSFRMLDLLLGRAVTRVLDSAIAPITESATPRLKFVVPW